MHAASIILVLMHRSIVLIGHVLALPTILISGCRAVALNLVASSMAAGESGDGMPNRNGRRWR